MGQGDFFADLALDLAVQRTRAMIAVDIDYAHLPGQDPKRGRQRANVERSINELKDQAELARQRIPVMEQLYSRGLVTNQQVIAARQSLIELNGQAADRTAQLKQLDAQEFELRTQTKSLNSAMQLDIANRQREITAATSELITARALSSDASSAARAASSERRSRPKRSISQLSVSPPE